MTGEGFRLLARAMYQNEADDLRDLAIADANAFAAAMGSEGAQRQLTAEAPAESDPRQASQAAAIGRLAALFNRQKRTSALRGAIRIKRPN